MNAYDHKLLQQAAQRMGVLLPPGAEEKLEQYAALLVETNHVMNLTAITDPEGIAIRHFADSLSVLSQACGKLLPTGAKVADVGSGAGFPMIPILLARPDLQAVLIDSLGKRVNFLQSALATLELAQRATAVKARAEEAGQGALRASFDAVFARAVKALPILLEYTLPLVKKGGVCIAWKGSDCTDEIKSAATALARLNGQVEAVVPITLAQGEDRSLVVVRKIGNTDPRYPRANAEMLRHPF